MSTPFYTETEIKAFGLTIEECIPYVVKDTQFWILKKGQELPTLDNPRKICYTNYMLTNNQLNKE